MATHEEELWETLASSIVNMDEEETKTAAQDLVNHHYSAYDGITHGLTVGMDRVGQLYEEEEYYIPELLMCSDAMYAGLQILRPYLPTQRMANPYHAIVGVVAGDTHDIGKNLFKIMLETNGFTVTDLGRDVPTEYFIQKIKELHPAVVGMSTLMTTTMDAMSVVMNRLRQEHLRDDLIVMVGGGPVSQHFADTIGADGYAPEASRAARLAKRLVEEKFSASSH